MVNVVHSDLTNGIMDLQGFFLWCIKDIVGYVMFNSTDKDDKLFLQTNKRAKRILDRYEIKLIDQEL